MKRTIPVLLLVMCIFALPAVAARKEKPTGKEIADKAKAAKLDNANATVGEKGAKKIKLTPADLSQVKSQAEFEDGQVLGVLETEATGDETPLSPGKYNLCLAKVGNDWHIYAESGGNVAAEALRVRVEAAREKPASKKPEFHPQGWCWGFWYICGWNIWTGPQWCYAWGCF